MIPADYDGTDPLDEDQVEVCDCEYCLLLRYGVEQFPGLRGEVLFRAQVQYHLRIVRVNRMAKDWDEPGSFWAAKCRNEIRSNVGSLRRLFAYRRDPLGQATQEVKE